MSHWCSVSCICMLEYVMALISVPLVWMQGSYFAPHLRECKQIWAISSRQYTVLTAVIKIQTQHAHSCHQDTDTACSQLSTTYRYSMLTSVNNIQTQHAHSCQQHTDTACSQLSSRYRHSMLTAVIRIQTQHAHSCHQDTDTACSQLSSRYRHSMLAAVIKIQQSSRCSMLTGSPSCWGSTGQSALSSPSQCRSCLCWIGTAARSWSCIARSADRGLDSRCHRVNGSALNALLYHSHYPAHPAELFRRGWFALALYQSCSSAYKEPYSRTPLRWSHPRSGIGHQQCGPSLHSYAI